LYRFILLSIVFFYGLSARAEPGGFHFELGEEYSDYNRTSPNSPSNASKIRSPKSSGSFWRRAGLYLPNRFLDLIDILKFDVGAGVGYGGVIRPTRYLQAGYRNFDPGMLRVGLMGRRAPVLIEKRKLAGFGDNYGRISSRKVSPGEFGLGIDAGLVGVYGGISLDSTADFILGIFGVDFEDDDLR
jgi:hypothetical protein